MGMADFITVSLVGMDKIEAKLKILPDAVADMGVEAANNYLLNAVVRKEVPAYKHISYQDAYGKPPAPGFFYKLKHGLIDVPYRRRGPGSGVTGSWFINGKGRTSYLTNNDPAAHWVYSENQARMMSMIGWLRVSQIIDKYTRQIVGAFDRSVRNAIKKVGL
jgi:hypothetical protein